MNEPTNGVDELPEYKMPLPTMLGGEGKIKQLKINKMSLIREHSAAPH